MQSGSNKTFPYVPFPEPFSLISSFPYAVYSKYMFYLNLLLSRFELRYSGVWIWTEIFWCLDLNLRYLAGFELDVFWFLDLNLRYSDFEIDCSFNCSTCTALLATKWLNLTFSLPNRCTFGKLSQHFCCYLNEIFVSWKCRATRKRKLFLTFDRWSVLKPHSGF